MSDNLLIETKEIGNHRIKIYYDEWAECPVTNWDMGAFHIFESLGYHSYGLCRDCDWKEWVDNPSHYSMIDILMRVVADVVSQKNIIKYIREGNVDNLRFIYNRSAHTWDLQNFLHWRKEEKDRVWSDLYSIEPSDLKMHDYRYELLETFDMDDLMNLIQKYAKDFVIKEWSSSGYSQGDHMRGFSCMTKKMFDERCGFSPEKYKTWQEQALTVIEGEVDCISMWAWGDVKGFILEKKVPFTKVYKDENREDEESEEWEEVDSCWGYYMKTEELIAEVIAEHDLKEVA